ncbi:hypothetical protein OG592_41175 (plasmid) [Streptomyces avidinii]|uniref:hypothetical protein n=1 Tax=Streptomyces avidinii TaxID=1895 RepID=UPI002F908A57|nr:hypothetical protein OG592_41175 [Streptomyces avidinii]
MGTHPGHALTGGDQPGPPAIDRVSSDIDQLTAEDRAQIEQAVTLVRPSRTVHLGMPRIGQPLPDVRPPRIHTS